MVCPFLPPHADIGVLLCKSPVSGISSDAIARSEDASVPECGGFGPPPAALRAPAFAQSLPLRKGFFCFSRASCKFSRVLG